MVVGVMGTMQVRLCGICYLVCDCLCANKSLSDCGLSLNAYLGDACDGADDEVDCK